MYWRIHVFGTKGSVESRDETTLTLSLIGERPDVRTYAPVDSLTVLIEAFAESIETGKPFPVTTDDMLNVVGAFEAIIRSIDEGKPVKFG
jgi:predicted dehydrogenase